MSVISSNSKLLDQNWSENCYYHYFGRYTENAKKASELLHDRPMEPIKLADYWIKYVVRHKGAPHLRVAGTNLPLYKYYMLDVFGAILAVVWISIFVTVKLVRLCCSRKNSSKLRKTKKKKYE